MSFKDMPLDAELQVGDIVTITGPGEHDVLVREVTEPNADKAGLMYFTDAVVESVLGRKNCTLIHVQRPAPSLPTVEGDYIHTTVSGHRYIRSLTGGNWRTGKAGRISEAYLLEEVENGATFTRVIPADEVKRPEVDIAAAREAFAATHSHSNDDPDDDFEAVLTRVLKGDFDK